MSSNREERHHIIPRRERIQSQKVKMGVDEHALAHFELFIKTGNPRILMWLGQNMVI